MWKDKDESWNFLQDYDPELIKEEKRKELESEIRLQVDELMRQELKNLKLAVNREKELLAKTGKKKGGKKAKKKKKGKKGKKGKDKDLTADRTIESLYKELVEEGLLIQALKVNLSDYIGEYSYLGTTLRHLSIEPMPSLLDVRQLIALYGVLPLGSAAVHENAPLVKSLLLAGPSGVGKKMLVHAICTETGANLFNLSAANIAGKYPGKSGLQMMLHVVLKVARQLQPSVVWIGDTEKTFYKKVPNAERTSPGPGAAMSIGHPCSKSDTKCQGQQLHLWRNPGGVTAALHRITRPPQDSTYPSLHPKGSPDPKGPRIPKAPRHEGGEPPAEKPRACRDPPGPGPRQKQYLGRLTTGWLAGFQVTPEKQLMRSDSPLWTSRPVGEKPLVLWKQIIQRHGGVVTNALNVSCLAKVTDGFTQGHIVQVVKGVLTERRVRAQTHKPLVALEFIPALSSMSPVYQEEEETFKDWYAKTPMGKKRALALKGENSGKAKDKGKKKGKEGKKEKKKK
ncbi:IQ and AAA domain-containing protein 1 [Pteropus alecto]|uniref:IQ and AAA domain-containing protein 1 n=1 Tax=Pteropus alecto TaxID=9402 RepID=L5KT14_PTEAL|nr:IQ and AAA domain-containing protein 1 [Pteropus alecto]